MSTPLVSRERGRAWFEQGCAAFRRSFPSIADKIPGDKFYVCPICLTAYSEQALAGGRLTREHVPPESLGGHRMVLTCAPCNSGGGHGADSHARREGDLIGFAKGEVREIKADLRTASGRLPVRLSAGGGGILVKGVRKAASKAAQKAVEGDFMASSGPGAWKEFSWHVQWARRSESRPIAAQKVDHLRA